MIKRKKNLFQYLQVDEYDFFCFNFVSSNNSYLVFHRVQQQVSWLIYFTTYDSESTINCILVHHGLTNLAPRGNASLTDLSRALDCIAFKLLISKLCAYGLSLSACELIKLKQQVSWLIYFTTYDSESTINCILVHHGLTNLAPRGNASLTDLSRALDCIAFKLLISKLCAYGLSLSACELIKFNYYSYRKHRVKVLNDMSDWQHVYKGSAQGFIMGPLSYNMFTKGWTI